MASRKLLWTPSLTLLCVRTEFCTWKLKYCLNTTRHWGCIHRVEPSRADLSNMNNSVEHPALDAVGGRVVTDYFTTKLNETSQDLDLFLYCWRLPTCDSCLHTTRSCSWCATSQTCVPNEVFRWPFAILAPIKTENVCPLGWRERWEMRARPFSCRCSSMTLVSVVVAVLSTMVGVLLLWLATLLLRLLWRKWKKREEGWWRFSHRRTRWTSKPRWLLWRRAKPNVEAATGSEEQTPLLT